jgi:hypothetical protein
VFLFLDADRAAQAGRGSSAYRPDPLQLLMSLDVVAYRYVTESVERRGYRYIHDAIEESRSRRSKY